MFKETYCSTFTFVTYIIISVVKTSENLFSFLSGLRGAVVVPQPVRI